VFNHSLSEWWTNLQTLETNSHASSHKPKQAEHFGRQAGGTCTSCDMAEDAPSVFQVQSAAPSLLAVPGLVHCLAATEPCSALSGCVLMPADHDALDCPTCNHNAMTLCHP